MSRSTQHPVLCQYPVHIHNIDVPVSRWQAGQHDQGTVLHDCPAARWVQATSGVGTRESRAAAATRGFQSQAQTVAASKNGSTVLGLDLWNLGKVARVANRRQARYCDSMASEGICPLLDVAIETKSHWASWNQQRDQGVDPEDGGSELFMGKPADPRRTAETRDRHLGANCSPAYAEAEETAITDLARVAEQLS
jgi:hypothetical protein